MLIPFTMWKIMVAICFWAGCGCDNSYLFIIAFLILSKTAILNTKNSIVTSQALYLFLIFLYYLLIFIVCLFQTDTHLLVLMLGHFNLFLIFLSLTVYFVENVLLLLINQSTYYRFLLTQAPL